MTHESVEVQDYSIENLSDTQKAMLEDLRDYGLIWQRRVSKIIGILHVLFSQVQVFDF